MKTYEAHFLKSQGVLVHFDESDYNWFDNPERIPEAQDDGVMVFIYFQTDADFDAAEFISKTHYGDYISPPL